MAVLKATKSLRRAQIFKREQRYFEGVVQSLFPDLPIQCDVRREIHIRYPNSGSCIEIDVWIPDITLAFELQDKHHYFPTWYTESKLEIYQEKDDVKASMMANRGFTLLAVPYWWTDKGEAGLIATIQKSREELIVNIFTNSSAVLDAAPPTLSQNAKIPGVGELMIPSFKPVSSFDPYHWWMGEKFDGERACWNPKRNVLYSRKANAFIIPSDIQKKIPLMFLDGEIWFGRGKFSQGEIFSDFRKVSNHLRYIVFDQPEQFHQTLGYEKRFQLLIERVSRDHPFVCVNPRMMCEDSNHMIAFSNDVLKGGGEGLVIRQPNSIYQQGRSTLVLKLKNLDTEALIIEVHGSRCTCLLATGATFHASPIEAEHLRKKIQVGNVVSFRFKKISDITGKPCDPEIYQIRPDLTWEDVLASQSLLKKPKVREPTWLSGWKSMDNKRKFFTEFAASRSFDPLDTAKWYTFTNGDIKKAGGRSILVLYYKGSLINALIDIFPELKFEREQFLKVKDRDWKDLENRRKFFDNFAKSRKFSPLDADKWYSTTNNHIRLGGGRSILHYYKGSHFQALMKLYPELGLQREKFVNYKAGDWKSVRAQRKFFDDFARSKKFNPLDASVWYSILLRDILKAGGSGLLEYHKKSHIRALIKLYPELMLQKSSFINVKNRKQAKINIQLIS